MAVRKPLLIGGGIVAALIVIIIVAVVVIFASIDSIIKAAIEKVGPQMTQTEVKVDSVSLSTTSGEGSLKGLKIGNPKGFTTDSAFRLGEIGLKVDVSSITSDVIHIREILIKAPDITYEIGSQGSNIDQIKKNVDSYVGSAGPGTPKAAEKKADTTSSSKSEQASNKKMIIDSLRIEDTKATIATSLAGGQKLSTGLPNIALKDIGKDKGGASPAEVVDRIVAAIEEQAKAAASKMGVDQLKGAAKGALDNATKGLTGSGSTSGSGVGDAVKGLFGK